MVQIFLHKVDQALIAAALAKGADSAAQRRGVASLVTEIAIGQRVDVALDAPSMAIDEPIQSLIWHGEPRACQFFVSLPSVAGVYPLRARLFIQSIPIGSLRFNLTVSAKRDSQTTQRKKRGELSKRYRRAFLSYASGDLVEVLKRAQALSVVGINFFQDILSIEPGERWKQRLFEEIDKCDLFLLFWSSSASRSEWVVREAEYALSCQKKMKEEIPDIVPVILEGPPIPFPPESLKHIQFNDALCYTIAAATAVSHEPEKASLSSTVE